MELRTTVYKYQSRPIPAVNAKSFLHAKTQLPQNLLGLAGFIGLIEKENYSFHFQL